MTDPTPALSTTVAAGWYPDPTTGQARYWDGTAWTNAYQPVASPPNPPRPTSGFAISGLVVSILAFLFGFTGIFAIPAAAIGLILSILGIGVTGATDKKSGRGAAITGLILAIIALIASCIFFFVYLTLPSTSYTPPVYNP